MSGSSHRFPAHSFLTHLALTVVGVGVAFVLGRMTASESALDAQGVITNGPSPVIPPINPGTVLTPPAGAGGTTSSTSPLLPYSSGDSASVGANGILAVTGSYGVGTSVLYVIDTETKQLAVYEARGGSRSMRRLTLVGARRIDLDLQLRGYNDESEYPYAALEKMFDGRSEPASAPDTVHTIDPSRTGR